VRQALVHAAESMQADDLHHRAVRITHRRGEAALAWLLGGWLAARMPDQAEPVIEEAPEADDVLTLTCATGSGELTLTLTDQHVAVSGPGRASFTVAVPREDAADAVAAELRSLAQDVCLHDTLGALIRRFSATSP
jgi:glucose-6-phosphate dehydrogenase assembly protein OpcA